MVKNSDNTHSKQISVGEVVRLPSILVRSEALGSQWLSDMEDIVLNTFIGEETIPLCEWANKENYRDYNAYIQQNGNNFGYIPMNDLKL